MNLNELSLEEEIRSELGAQEEDLDEQLTNVTIVGDIVMEGEQPPLTKYLGSVPKEVDPPTKFVLLNKTIPAFASITADYLVSIWFVSFLLKEGEAWHAYKWDQTNYLQDLVKGGVTSLPENFEAHTKAIQERFGPNIRVELLRDLPSKMLYGVVGIVRRILYFVSSVEGQELSIKTFGDEKLLERYLLWYRKEKAAWITSKGYTTGQGYLLEEEPGYRKRLLRVHRLMLACYHYHEEKRVGDDYLREGSSENQAACQAVANQIERVMQRSRNLITQARREEKMEANRNACLKRITSQRYVAWPILYEGFVKLLQLWWEPLKNQARVQGLDLYRLSITLLFSLLVLIPVPRQQALVGFTLRNILLERGSFVLFQDKSKTANTSLDNRIPLPQVLSPLLRLLLHSLPENEPSTAPLFRQRNGKAWNPGAIYRFLNSLGRVLFGIARFSSHICRHAFITEMVARGFGTRLHLQFFAQAMFTSERSLLDIYIMRHNDGNKAINLTRNLLDKEMNEIDEGVRKLFPTHPTMPLLNSPVPIIPATEAPAINSRIWEFAYLFEEGILHQEHPAHAIDQPLQQQPGYWSPEEMKILQQSVAEKWTHLQLQIALPERTPSAIRQKLTTLRPAPLPPAPLQPAPLPPAPLPPAPVRERKRKHPTSDDDDDNDNCKRLRHPPIPTPTPIPTPIPSPS